MSTGRTTDDRDTDSARYRALKSVLDDCHRLLVTIEERVGILEQQGRSHAQAQRLSQPLPRPDWMQGE